MYGPVLGMGRVPMSAAGTSGGTGAVKKDASLYRKSESDADRWNVTVLAWSSTVMPFDRSQDDPATHWSAPTRPVKNEAADVLSANTRSRPWRKSAGRMGSPFE